MWLYSVLSAVMWYDTFPSAISPRPHQVVSYTVDEVTNSSMTIRWQTNARGATALTKLRSDMQSDPPRTQP